MSAQPVPNPPLLLRVLRRTIGRAAFSSRVTLILLLVLALIPAVAVLPVARAVAAIPSPVASSVVPSAARRAVGSGALKAARSTTPNVTPNVAITPAPTAKARTAVVAASPAANTYTVSKAVLAFLSSGLGLPLGGSPKLSGTASGTTITFSVGTPTKLGLPTGVAAPALGKAKIVINKQTNTLTVTAAASGAAPAALNIRVAHANTSTLPSTDLTGSLSMTESVLGRSVALVGPLTDVGGKPMITLTGPISTADTFTSVTLAKGDAVTLDTGHGLRVAGAATVGAGSAGNLSANASVVIDTTTGHATFMATQKGALTLSKTPAVSLSGVSLAGTLTGTTPTLTGAGLITVGTDTPVNAPLSITSAGVLVVDFSTDLSAFGLGSPGQFGEVLWAAASVASYPVASSGRTISLGAGFSSSTGKPATLPTAPPTPTPPTGPPVTGSTYSISAAAETFLNSIGLKLGSTTLSGTVSGSTLTLTAAAPSGLPITLPSGDQAITFGATTLVIDTAADTLTVSATASASKGTAATLSITVNHVSTTTLSSADLVATLHITGLSVFGATVDLDGSITYSAGKVGVAVMGTLTSDVVVSPAILTIDSGTVVSYSSTDGLTVNGTVELGTDPAKFTVAFTGTIADLKNWSLMVSDSGSAPSFQPTDNLTITPDFTGTLTDANGTLGFDVSGNDLTSWQASDAVTVAVKHVEVSNLAPPSTVKCPAGLKDGQLWLDASGTVTYAPPGSAINVTGSVDACVAPTAKAATLTAGVNGTLLPSTAGFQIDNINLTVNGDLAAKSFTVSASAQLTVTAVGDAAPFTIGLSFASDGSFVAGASVPDLSSLGLSGTNGWLLLASKAVPTFDPADLGIHNTDGSDITPFDLPAGVTVTMAFSLDDKDVKAMQALHVPLNGAQVQLMATLSTTSFAVKIEVNFGAGDQGLTLIDTASGIKLILDTFYVDFDLNETSVTLGLGGTAYLQVPSVVPGIPDPSHIEVGLNGTINLDTLTFSVGVSLAGACGTATCTWPDAFGIKGLNLDSLSGQIGVDFETAVPTPTIALKVQNLVLPASWASAIGMVAGTTVSLALDLNLSQPLVNIEIDPAPGSTIALTPLSIFSTNSNVIDSFVVNKAHLLFAPLGGTEADGTVVNPGVSLDFMATIGGVQASVAAAVDLDPTNPSITADVSVDSFSIGSVAFNSPMLHLAISPTSADFSFSGGFSDYHTGISFSASVDLGVSTSLLNAAVSLTITGGLPGYLYGAGSLNGSVSVDANGLNLSASGSLYLSIGGRYFAAISVSYSGDASTIWRDLNNDADAVAAAFVNAFTYGPTTIYNILVGLGFNLQQIEHAVATAFSEGAAAVIEQLSAAGVGLETAIQTAITSLGAGENQIAAVLSYLGWSPSSIISELTADFGNTGAALYNALTSIGQGASSVIASIGSLFNNGSYNLTVHSSLQVMDVSGGSQNPGGSVIQYLANGGTNQDWYVLPTDSGYAELVNRNSGQCLTNPGSTGQTDLVQDPCTGDPTQQWSLGVYQGNSDLRFQTRIMTNRYSGLVAEVSGGTLQIGHTVEQYPYNGGSNQTWTFTPAA